MLRVLLLTAAAGLGAGSPVVATGAWTAISPPGFSWLSVSSLVVDSGGEHLYAATNHGVFRKARHEQQWSREITRRQFPGVSTFVLDPLVPSTLYAGTVATQQKGALRSDDFGETWKAIEPNGAIIALAVDSLLPSTVFAIAHFYPHTPHIGPLYGGIFKSSDRGESWREVHPFAMSGWIGAIAVDPRDPRVVYAGASGAGVLKSTDEGETWSPVRSGFDAHSVHALFVDPVQGTVFAGTDRGLLRSGNGGAHWVRSNYGLPERAVLSFARDPVEGTIYAGTNGAGLFRSEDGGLRWVEIQPTLPNQVIISLAIDPVEGTLYAGTQRNGVFSKPIDRELSLPRSSRRVPFRGN